MKRMNKIGKRTLPKGYSMAVDDKRGIKREGKRKDEENGQEGKRRLLKGYYKAGDNEKGIKRERE